jgi:5-methylcytosine-specific restriction endonuclease McrA
MRSPYDSDEVFALKGQIQRATSVEERRRLQARIRACRLADARAKGTHTEYEWRDLVAKFDWRCVRCGCTPAGNPCKDHITPIYQGGSDAIVNLQPLCRECNSAKGPDTTNWAAYREEQWFLDVDMPEERF